MNPNNQGQGGDLSRVPANNGTPHTPLTRQPEPQQQQAAAANVIRTQIDALYGDSPVAAKQETPAAPATAFSSINQETLQQNLGSDTNPYNRTHSNSAERQSSVDPKQWKEYHSAWQDYYQKYYAAYYAHQETQKQARQKELQQAITEQAQQTIPVAAPPAPQEAAPQEISKNQAMQELRNKLRNNVQKRAEKVRKSRHFVPIVAALAVILIFVFIQYNRVFIATVNAYVSPGAIDPQNIIVDNDGANAVVGPEPRLIIPKVNVDVPVVYDIGADHDSQMAAMEKGVAHFGIPGANSRPGQKGNTVLSGHSSNDLFDRGDYKFIFAQLEKLKEGDTIYANYEGKRYTYVVTKTEVVKPTQVDKLVYPTDKPILTLITCTPLGTSLNRLLVTAEQISPSPTEATAAPITETGGEEAPMPGNSATLFERLFGRR